MSRKKKKKKQIKSASTSQSQNDANETTVNWPDKSGVGPVEQIRIMLSQDNRKGALELAKQYHRQTNTPESEQLLVDVYIYRIEGMLNKRMHNEAMALTELVLKNHVGYSTERLMSLWDHCAIHAGKLNQVLAPLSDPDIDSERRATIESIIRKEVIHLDTIAQCDSLPADHALRVNAALLLDAFHAVCSGPVTDDHIALDTVSRRSPLAPWKLLIRAIACFYRHEDEACLRCLSAMDRDSAPARLIPFITNILQGKTGDILSVAEKNLFEHIKGMQNKLESQLRQIDKSLRRLEEGGYIHTSQFSSTILTALSLCEHSRPGLADRLRQYLAIQLIFNDYPYTKIKKILVKPPRKDAHFWLMFSSAACFYEIYNLAAIFLDEYRYHAIHEGVFQENSIENALILRRIAQQKVSFINRCGENSKYDYPELIKHIPLDDSYYSDQSIDVRAGAPKVRPTSYYDEGEIHDLYKQASKLDPSDEVFREWMKVVEESFGKKNTDFVAEEWCRLVPDDPTPLIILAENAEKRNALQKALNYIKQAEEHDNFNINVRHAHVRLICANARRHLNAGKPHLVRKDIADLVEMEKIQTDNHQAIISGLQWACAVMDSNTKEVEKYGQETEQILGSNLAAYIFLSAIENEIKGNKSSLGDLPKLNKKQTSIIIDALAKSFTMCAVTGISMVLPQKWEKVILDVLSAKERTGDAIQLQTIAEGAEKAGNVSIAYVAAGAGIALGPPTEARFLLIRARILSWNRFEHRWSICANAAIQIARTARQMDIVNEAVDLLQYTGSTRGRFSFLDNIFTKPVNEMETKDVKKVLELECTLRKSDTLDEWLHLYNKKLGHLLSEPPSTITNILDFMDNNIDPDIFDDDFDSDDFDDFDDDDIFGDGDGPFEDEIDHDEIYEQSKRRSTSKRKQKREVDDSQLDLFDFKYDNQDSEEKS